MRRRVALALACVLLAGELPASQRPDIETVWIPFIELQRMDHGGGRISEWILLRRQDGHVHDWMTTEEFSQPLRTSCGTWVVLFRETRWGRGSRLIRLETYCWCESLADYDIEMEDRKVLPEHKRRRFW